MKRKVAIPVVNDLLSEYFGSCSHYEIFEVDGKIVARYQTGFPEDLSVFELPEWLEKAGITDIITFRINPEIINLFASKKVNLFVGIPLNSPQKLMEDYLQGKLESDEKIIQELYSTNEK